MPASPSTDNYLVGKGIVSFRPAGSETWRDMGNVTEMELTPTVERLDHFSSREGVRKKDKSIVIEKSMSVRLVGDEWSPDNVAMAVLGVAELDGITGHHLIEIFSRNAIEGSLRFIGTNEVGPQQDILLNNVSFLPSGSVSPLSEEWGTFELTGEVLVDEEGVYGVWTHREQEEESAE